jgi:hypothetical protein
MKRDSIISTIIATVVALNYFAFRVELFGDEYRKNHPVAVSFPSITLSTLNWETFDKDNASQAFTFNPDIRIVCLFCCHIQFRERVSTYNIPHPVRDKSPPISSQNM